MKRTFVFTVLIFALKIAELSASVGFKKQTAHSLLKKAPKERMLADSQQMLDAQDSRKILVLRHLLIKREN